MSRLRSSVLAFAALAAGCGSGTPPTSPSPLPPYQFPPGISYQIDGEPCVAPAAGPVNCRFWVVPESMRVPSAYYFQYNWRFVNPATGRGRDGPPGVTIQPAFDCTFSPGPHPFEVHVTLSVHAPSAEATMYVNGTAVIARPPGACQ